MNWLTRMKADPTDWLVHHEDPMVRYRTLTWIVDRTESDPEVRAARQEAARHPRLQELLAGQSPSGAWEDPSRFVTDYYYGTVWRLCLAAQLGADLTEEVRRGIEFVFSVSQSRAGGGFSRDGTPSKGGVLDGQWACLTGAMVEMLVHFGYTRDSRTQRALGFLVSRQQRDGLYPCENFRPNTATLPFNCYMGSVKPLLAVLAIPPERRDPPLRLLAERTARTLLTYRLHLYKRAADGTPAAKTEWLDFGYPRFWNTDLLEVAWALARVGHGARPELEPALKLILERQLRNGRWRLEFDYSLRLPIRIEKHHGSSPWITLRALHTLKLASAVAMSLQPA